MFNFLYILIQLAILLALVLSSIYVTMLVSERYDNLDRKDIRDFNVKEIFFLIWDHREKYLSPAIFFCSFVIMWSLR
jgi:hypothetical protein